MEAWGKQTYGVGMVGLLAIIRGRRLSLYVSYKWSFDFLDRFLGKYSILVR
jgi:hypothetical protein